MEEYLYPTLDMVKKLHQEIDQDEKVEHHHVQHIPVIKEEEKYISKWKNEKVTLNPGEVNSFFFNERHVNHVIIYNNSYASVKASLSANVDNVNFEIDIPPYGTRIIARQNPFVKLFLYSDFPSSLVMDSFYEKFSPLTYLGNNSNSPVNVQGVAGISIQSHLQKTIQTHNAVSVPASGTSSQSSYMDLQGFDMIAITFINDAAQNSALNIFWSNDGSTIHGLEQIIASSTSQTKSGETTIKARYAKIQLTNSDAGAAHIMSAWAYLKS